MDNDRYARYGALTGIVFVVLLVIGFLIVTPTPPDLDSPVDEWSQYYIDNQDSIRAALVLVTASLFFFIWFLGSVATGLRVAFGNPRLPTVAFGGGSPSSPRCSSRSPRLRSPPTGQTRSAPS